MAKIKLTKSAIDAAQPQAQSVELRDTLVPGFMCKVTPAGRKVFMLQYRTNAGERRKPALGLYGELTVEQARSLAQTWLAEVRRGGDPGGDKTEARKAPTVKELCGRFMSDYSKVRNKPSTQKGYQGNIDRNIIPILGRMKVQDVKRPDVAMMMKKLVSRHVNNETYPVHPELVEGRPFQRVPFMVRQAHHERCVTELTCFNTRADSDGGQPYPRRHAKDVQHGRNLGLAAGWHESLSAHPPISSRQDHPAYHRRRNGQTVPTSGQS